jgi:hypothetical protein
LCATLRPTSWSKARIPLTTINRCWVNWLSGELRGEKKGFERRMGHSMNCGWKMEVVEGVDEVDYNTTCNKPLPTRCILQLIALFPSQTTQLYSIRGICQAYLRHGVDQTREDPLRPQGGMLANQLGSRPRGGGRGRPHNLDGRSGMSAVRIIVSSTGFNCMTIYNLIDNSNSSTAQPHACVGNRGPGDVSGVRSQTQTGGQKLKSSQFQAHS